MARAATMRPKGSKGCLPGVSAKLCWLCHHRYLSPVLHLYPDGGIIRLIGAGLVNRPNPTVRALSGAQPGISLAHIAVAARSDTATILKALNAQDAPSGAIWSGQGGGRSAAGAFDSHPSCLPLCGVTVTEHPRACRRGRAPQIDADPAVPALILARRAAHAAIVRRSVAGHPQPNDAYAFLRI